MIESPYAGPDAATMARHVAYARAALADSLGRGEAPLASHLLYTQAGDDGDPKQRAAGIATGLAWGAVAAATVVYADLGISPGMAQGIEAARLAGRPVEARRLPAWSLRGRVAGAAREYRMAVTRANGALTDVVAIARVEAGAPGVEGVTVERVVARADGATIDLGAWMVAERLALYDAIRAEAARERT